MNQTDNMQTQQNDKRAIAIKIIVGFFRILGKICRGIFRAMDTMINRF